MTYRKIGPRLLLRTLIVHDDASGWTSKPIAERIPVDWVL